MSEYSFRRFVNGKEMAEGVKINRADSLERAMQKAAALCPPAAGTVLVLDSASAIKAAETDAREKALEEAARAVERAGYITASGHAHAIRSLKSGEGRDE